MKSLRLFGGLAAFALLTVLCLAPPAMADSATGGVASISASLDETSAGMSGVAGDRISTAAGVTVDPAAFPAAGLSSTDISGVRIGWDLAADTNQIGKPGVDNGIVYALATASDGTVYAGGSFTSAGGNTAIQYIGKWRRNTGWASLGTFTAGTVRAIAIGPDGKVYAGGDFSDVKVWNGSAWSSLGGAPFSGGSVRALAVSGSVVYAGGDFTAPAAGLARYSGGTWSAVGGGLHNNNADAYALLFVGSDLYVGGSFLNVGASDGLPAANLARWDGAEWHTVGSSPPLSAQQYVDALASSEGNLYVANRYVASGGFEFYQVTSPAGAATWNQLAASANCNDIANDCDRVYAISASQNNIFIGGTFTNSNAIFAPALTATTSSMAWWNRKANTWSAMDGGVTAPVSGVIPGWMQGVRALAMDRTSLYAGGEFMTAKGSTVPAARISRWSQTIADLALYGTVSPTGTVYVGDQIAYNLTIENLGYATATGTSLYATLPAGVTFVSATSPCTHSAGVVTCNIGNLSLAASTTKTITVRVPTTATGGTVYDFSANVKANQYDPTLVSAFFGNSQLAYSHTAQEKAVLTLAMTGPDTAAGNAVLTYDMTVGNTGPSIARGASLIDTLPAGAVFTETSSGCTYSSSTGKVTCSLGDMAVGASETRSVSYMTGGCTTGALVNNATATSPQTQTAPAAQKSTTITAFTGLAINKSDGLTIAGLNEFLTYRIKTWACGASVTNVVIADPLPASLTWDTSTTTAGTCTQASGTVTCNAGTLASGGSVDVSIKARTTVEEMLSNTATASGDSVTSVSATDDDTQVGDFADLTLALTAPADVTAGIAFNYTLDVTNNGPSAVTDASVTVDLPDGIYYNAATGATCALDTGSLNISANLTCSVGALAVDETKSFTLSATAVQPVQGADVAYTASATVDSAKDHDTAAANTDGADTTASAGTLATQTLDGVEVSAYVLETTGSDKRAYGVALDDHFYLAGLNDSVLFAASGATSLAGGGKLNYKKGDVPVYEGDFSSTKTAAWKLTLDPAGEAKVPDVAGFEIKVPENSTLTEVDLPNGKVKGTTDELKLDPPNCEKEVSANFELDSSTTQPNKPSYGGKVNEAFQLDAGIFKLDIPTDAPISDTGINSTSNVDLVMPVYFGSGEVIGSSAGLRHWPELDDASMTVGGAPGAGFDVPDLKFDTAENFKVKGGTGQLVSAGGKYEAVITSAKLEVDLPANADKEIKKPDEQGGTLDTVYLSPKMKDDGTPETLPDGSMDSDISSSALPEFHLDVAKGDLKVVSAMLKKDGISVSLADYKMPPELGERNKVTPDVKVSPKKDVTQAEMKVNTDETFDVADMDVKDGEKLKVKEARAKVVQQTDGFKLDVTSGKVQVTVLEQNDKLTDLGSATVDKDGKLDGKLANDELTIKVASADLTMKGLSKDHALTSQKGLESDAGKWKLPDELGGQEKDFTPPDKIKIDDRGLKINEDKEVDFPPGHLDDNGHPFEAGKATLKEADDRTYKLEIKNKVQIDIPGSQGRKPKENPADPDEKPDAELTLDSQKKITGKVKDMELIVSGLTLKDTEWKVEKGQVFSDKAEMKQIEDFGGEKAQLGQMAVLDKNAGLVLGEEAGAAALAGLSLDAIEEVADINVTLPSLEYLGFSMFNVEGSIHATDRYAADGSYCMDDDGESTDACDGVKDSYAIHALASLGLEDMFGGGGGDDGGSGGGDSGGGSGGEGEGGGLPCSSISVEIDLVLGEHQATMVSIRPTDGRIIASTLAVAANPDATDTANLELRAIAAQLMLSCSVPLGQSGLQISEFSGGFEMDKDLDLLRVNVGANIETVMAIPPPIDAAVAEGAVTATIEVKPQHYFRVEGEVTVIGFIRMAEGYAQVDFTEYGMPNGVEAEVTLRYPIFMEGTVGFHVWTDWDPLNDGAPEFGDFHFTGWAGVKIGLSKGLIWEECALGICISIPPWDLWLAEVSAEIGEFCAEGGGSVWGFKCEISILSGLWSGGMYVDADGNIDFGDVDEYVLYDNEEVTAAFLAWREVQAGKLAGAAALAANQKFKGFAFAPDDTSYTYQITAPSDLAFMLTRTGAEPTMTLEDPDGNTIDPYTPDTDATVAYDEATSETLDEDGATVLTTQVTYIVADATPGDWLVHLHGDTESSEYIFTVLGAGLSPSLSNVQVTDNGDGTAAVSWQLTDDAAPVVNIYATLGPTETEIASPSIPGETMMLPVFGGERLLQVTDSQIDGEVNIRTIDLSGLENGDYYIHVEADDAQDPPQHQYWLDGDGNKAQLTVNRPLPTAWTTANIRVTPEYMGLHVEFDPLEHPDIDRHIVRYSDAPAGETPTYTRLVTTTTNFANSEDWLVPGQTYYIAVAAYEGDTGHVDGTTGEFVGATLIWSDEVTGIPLGASFELVAAEPAITVVGGGDSALAYFQVINTGDVTPNVGLYVADAPEGIDVNLIHRFVLATASGAVGSLELSATDTLRGGTYPVTIAGSAGGTTRTLELLVTVEEPRFELAATPAALTMATGESVQVQIDATRLFGEMDPINLDVSAPRGLGWSIDDDRLEGSDNAILTLSDTFMLTGGDYTLHVLGRDGEHVYDLPIALELAKPKFTLAAVPLNWRVAPDGQVAIRLDVGAEYDWDTAVTLSVNPDYLPYGIIGGLSETTGGTPAASLTVNAPTTVYLKVAAAADAAEDLYVLHVDAASGDQTAVVEPRLWVRTTCDVADLSVTVEDDPDPVQTGQDLTYDLTVTNNGPCSASGRTLTFTLPTGAAWKSGAGCTASGSTVTCSVGALNTGATTGMSAGITAPATGTGSLSTTFSLNDIATDWEPGNDSAAAETLLNSAPVIGTLALMPGAVEGQDLYAEAAFTDADGNGPFACTVDYGDGAQPGSIVSDVSGTRCVGPTHAYADDGNYTVTVSVTDSHAAAGAKTESKTVANALPVVGALDISLRPSTENQAIVISGTFTDAGANDADWTCAVDFGDGVSEAGVVTNGTCRANTHTYTDNGAFDVTISVTDKDSGTGTRTASMVVNNAAPSLTGVANDGPITEGGAATLTATASDVAAAADPLEYWFDCKNDGFWEAGPQSESTAICTYQDNGTFEAQVRVGDGDGGWAFGSTTVIVTNAAPVVAAIETKPASSSTGGGKVYASATFTDAGVLDFPRTSLLDAQADDEDLPPAAATCTVDYGDGTVQTQPIVGGDSCYGLGHTYHASGDYTITITVADKDGAAGSSTLSYTVLNVPPDIDTPVVTPNASNEGDPIVVTATFTDPDPEDAFGCVIDYGDGTLPALGVVEGTPETGYTCTGAPYAYADNGGFTVTVTVTDSYDMSDSEFTTHVVSNVDPTVGAPSFSPEPSAEGSQVMFNAAISDPGTGDTFTCEVTYGDVADEVAAAGIVTGSAATGYTCAAPAHTYTDNGSYTVTVTVTDDDGGIGSNSATHVVDNVTPEVNAGADASVDEGSPFTQSGSFTDPGTDTWTATVDYGDGSGTQPLALTDKTFSLSHTYADNGSYTVTVTVTDDDGGAGSDTVMVTVLNVKPAVDAGADASVDEGSPFTQSGSFTDPGADTWTATVDYGDGSGAQPLALTDKTFNLSHDYLDNGSYTVTVTVTDDDGGAGSDTAVVTVLNVAPVATIDKTTQTQQYSDSIAPVTIRATDMQADALALTTQWKLGDAAYQPGLPGNLLKSADGACTPLAPYSHTCTWTLSGVLDVPAGTYTIEATVNDGDGGTAQVFTEVIVVTEDVDFVYADANPSSVKVATDGGVSGAFTLAVQVKEEAPDAGLEPLPGDISRAAVSMALLPVGPGGAPTGTCTRTMTPGSGYDGYVTLTCSYTAAAVNTYVVAITVSGGYYAGYTEEGLIVYDPSLGFAAGGGWFYWPGTANPETGYPGDKTNFGFTMKYKKDGGNVQGNLLLIRHLPDEQIYRLKSNALYGLALGSDTTIPMGWATFGGKATYQEPGWPEPIGNYEFTVYAEDRNEPGTGIDRFWMEVKDKARTIVPIMSLPREATANAVAIGGGNISIPHAVVKKAAAVGAFIATAADGVVRLQWETLSEPNLEGFNIYRAPTSEGEWVRCNEQLIATADTAEAGTQMYEWVDTPADPGAEVWYMLEAVSPDGTAETLGLVTPAAPTDSLHLWLPLVIR